ncbi:MAG: glycosyltransferase [Salinarimonas sp.]|nr:glycosyltransferase [Salinarimonas sp.]
MATTETTAEAQPASAGGPLVTQRILHVFRAPIGGLFRHVLDLACEQAARGHAVGLFFDSSKDNARTHDMIERARPALSLGITRVPMARNPSPRDFSAMRALAGLQREIDADILHGHGSKGGLYARALPRRYAPHAVRAYTPHGGSFHFGPGNPRHHLFMAAERWLSRRTDVFLFESRYVAGCFDRYVGATDRPAMIVHNGLYPAEFEPVDTSEASFDLVFIGEMLLAKGVDTLLQAMRLIREKRGKAPRLLAVGSGPDRDLLIQRAREYGLADEVTFEDAQPIRSVLARAHAMVMPSHAESLPYVVLEAAAAGMSLIATNVGGIPEILAPCADDLIDPRDVGALAQAILRHLTEDSAATRARNAAIRAFLETNFSIGSMTDAVLAGYAKGRERKALAMQSR